MCVIGLCDLMIHLCSLLEHIAIYFKYPKTIKSMPINTKEQNTDTVPYDLNFTLKNSVNPGAHE